MIFLLLWIVSGYNEKFNLSVPVLVHLILHILVHGKLGVLKRFYVGTLPPLKTSGTQSLNF